MFSRSGYVIFERNKSKERHFKLLFCLDCKNVEAAVSDEKPPLSLKHSTKAKCLLDRVPVVSGPVTLGDLLFANWNTSLFHNQLGGVRSLIKSESDLGIVGFWPSAKTPLLNNLLVRNLST